LNTGGFVALDDRLVAATPGVVVVQGPQAIHAAVVAHIGRRLRASGVSAITAAARSGAPLFREAAAQLEVTTSSLEPAAWAEVISEAATSAPIAIVATLPRERTWDYEVAESLVRTRRPFVLFITTQRPPSWDVPVFEIGARLGSEDKSRWLAAMAEAAHAELAAGDLAHLEDWWRTARRAKPESGDAPSGLSASAHALATQLALIGRMVDAGSFRQDVSRELNELVTSGFAVRSGSLVGLAWEVDVRMLEAGAVDADRLIASEVLIGHDSDPDAWALARAAHLLLATGRAEDADAAIDRALSDVAGTHVGSEIAERWFDATLPMRGPGGLLLRRRAAERALSFGDAEAALRWCESAQALKPRDASTALLMGQALVQLGDPVAARVSLEKAHTWAADDEQRARVAVELAEVGYLAGEVDTAAEYAKQAIVLASSAATQLAARNTLGKMHLLRARWEEADRHFAEVALMASAAGENAAELRARLNRAIALMSNGLLEQSRAILERVRDDAVRLKEERAEAFACINLGVVACRQRDYVAALAGWDRALRLQRVLPNRASATHALANLAELRLRLGLVAHAEQALAFGRSLVAADAPASFANYLHVGAKIALARGNTEVARREAEAARKRARSSGDVETQAWVEALMARIALEEGNLAEAAACIAHAEEATANLQLRAEARILRASYLRAMGTESSLEVATEAAAVARTSGDDDLLVEAHMLLATIYKDRDDLDAARSHCARALAMLEQVASTLPPDIRTAYLAKPQGVAALKFQASLAGKCEAVELGRTDGINTHASRTIHRELVGDHPQIRSLMVSVKKVARANATVLIQGESGTGKELVAEALHRASDRCHGPLVSVNCAALVETLLLSELFGHEKGAFTGASNRRRGRFELAEGGTLFLDEIGDITPRTQMALLRVLQEKTFERVGGVSAIHADVRVVCATHRNLKAMVESGEFREDLYYRLRGITLEVPPLRIRTADLPKLCEHLLSRLAAERNEPPKSLTADAVALLQRHKWPGNVRELDNVLRAVTLFADSDVIDTADLVANVDDLRAVAQLARSSQGAISVRTPAVEKMLESERGADDSESRLELDGYDQIRRGTMSLYDLKRQIEQDCIVRALTETKGNISQAALLLGMKRPRLSQLAKKYRMSVEQEEES
jgi:DNA-binding NtrC family response regulator/tetratricopeptide (TPR) repeat protein